MRLLIIEDDTKLADIAARALRAQGYVVDLAIDGAAGSDLLQTHAYDLIVLDLLLPRLSGMEVLRLVRRSDPALPVLVVSALDGVEDKVRVLEAGADDYLAKPFDLAELSARAHALMRRHPIEHSDVILLSDLEVDRLTHEVHRAGERIELTGREYALLELLVSSPERIFSRSVILEHVWDPSFQGVANIVEVCVRHLQRKLDDPFPVKLIHSVRGIGYCVRESPPR